MGEIMLKAKEDPNVRCVLIYGAQGNLSSGNDLQNFILEGGPPDPLYVHEGMFSNFLFPKPIYYFV